jgi:hypothetical protein
MNGGEWLFDGCLKSYVLGSACVLIAGSSLPAMIAIEHARGWISMEVDAGERALSVLAEAACLQRLLRSTYASLVLPLLEGGAEANQQSSVLVAGWLDDGGPAIVRIDLDLTTRAVALYRAEAGRPICVATGDDWFSAVFVEAMRSKLPAARSMEGAVHLAASVFRDVIRHQGKPALSIGGGLSLGISLREKGRPWVWPVVEIDGLRYQRGLRVSGHVPEEWRSLTFEIETDDALMARAEQSLAPGAEHALTLTQPVAIIVDCREHGRFARDVHRWLGISEREERALTELFGED